MTTSFRFRQLRSDEEIAAARRTQITLGATEDFDIVLQRVRDRASQGLVWVLVDSDTDAVLGQIALAAADHCFGGRRVPCQQVIDVLVVPECRGKGVGSAMMREAIKCGVREGLGLSLLLPSTTAFYRNSGWERGGTFTKWRTATRLVPMGGPSMRLLDGEWDRIEACQARWALCFNGPEIRSNRTWAKVRTKTQFAYGLDNPEDGELEAYLLVYHEALPHPFQHQLVVADWAALSPRGMQAVVGFVGHQGTMARDVIFSAPTPNPWGPLLPEQDLERVYEIDWMARPLDLLAAISARGFPEGIAIEVDFAVNDRVVESNQGPWRLVVGDGRGRLEPASSARVNFEVTAVGPLFTGYRSAYELERAGLLVGSSDAMALVNSAFTGTLPTVFDFF